jgi:hypothetical protein
MHNLYKFKQASTNVLTQISTIQKGLIKYKKINGTTHMQTTHFNNISNSTQYVKQQRQVTKCTKIVTKTKPQQQIVSLYEF